MTTRTLLLTLAASVAPLYAQQPATPAPLPAAELFTALATPPAQAEATTPEQRAQVFNSLALLPQNVSDFVVLTRMGDNLLRLAESGRLPELSPGDIPGELLALDNIALATTPATQESYALLQHALVRFHSLGSTMQLASEWSAKARPELADMIVESLLASAQATPGLPEGTAEQARIPASYLVLTCKPGSESVLQQYQESLLRDLRESGRPGVTPVEDAKGFSGVRVNLAEASSACPACAYAAEPAQAEALRAQLEKHPAYVLTRLQGNALIIALCEDPQELQLAATPADSLLATDKLAACDAQLSKGMIAASHLSPELSAIGNAANTQPTLNLISAIQAVFTRLGEQEPGSKPVYGKAISGLNVLSEALGKLVRPITRPSTMQMWYDADLHLRLTSDAQGCAYCPGTLRLASMADAPRTSLYAETTPVQLGLTPPDSTALLDAALCAAEGFALTLGSEDRQQATAALEMARAFMPELQSFAAAGATIGSGLNGQAALVVDSAYAPMPAVPGAQPGIHADSPRFALFVGVSDRSKLGAGWDALRSVAGQVAEKLGAPAEIVYLLPIASRQVGSTTSYSIALPFFTQDAVPSVAVTDTGLALGSSTNLTTQVAGSATGTVPFAGSVFALRFEPLARTLRSLATALDPDAEEAEPAAQSDVRLEKEGAAPVAVVGGADGPTSLFLCSEASDTEDAADQLSTAAALAEFAATIAEGVYAASTIENGEHTIHIRLRMK